MNEQVMSYVRNPLVALATGTVVGTLAGAGGMFFFGRKRYEGKVRELEHQISVLNVENYHLLQNSRRQVAEIQAFVSKGAFVIDELRDSGLIGGEKLVQPTEDQLRELEDEPAEPVELHKSDPGVFVNVTPITITPEPADQEVESATITTLDGQKVNLFDGDDTWDYELELNNRDPGKPYVIHEDEFTGLEFGFEQSTLTWYEADQILTDSHDVPIARPDIVVGELKFGHGAGAPNVCFVRNERNHAEYEVLQDPGSYQVQFLGLDPIERQYEEQDLKHSRSPRRFRDD